MTGIPFAVISIALLAISIPLHAQETVQHVVAEVDGDALLAETPLVSLPLPMVRDPDDDTHIGVFPPLIQIEMPVAGYMYGVEYDLVDTEGNELPRRILHHFNIIDPGHREMFLPISRRLFAAGQETGPYRVPKTLLGIAFEKGDTFLLTAMLHNPTDKSYDGVQLKVRLKFTKRGLPWPLVRVIPFQMDTLFPTGNKSFDLPPGKTTRSWEGSPVTEGRIIAIGSHLHDMATRIYLEDVTEGEIIWTGMPVLGENGRLDSITRGEFYGSYGVLIRPDHVYRVTAEYDNPNATTIVKGGMGVIAGVIIPSDPDFDFSADASDSLYTVDYAHFMREFMKMDMETGGQNH